jgi:hypothetical protein
MKTKLKEAANYIYGIIYALMLIGIACVFIGIIVSLFTFTFKWVYLVYLLVFIAGNYLCKIIYEKLFI